MKKIAFYPGSFDPVTNGHIDVLRQATAIADEIVIGIGVHPGKKAIFTFDQRVDFIRNALSGVKEAENCKITVNAFDRLVVDAARNAGASVLVRGLRDSTDFDYEMQMVGMNGEMAPDLTTVFIPASPPVRHITATLVRQIAQMGGDVSPFVPSDVRDALAKVKWK